MNKDLSLPKNQHQQALWYLYKWNSFSLKDVINDSMFYKFQTRLSDVERELKKEIAERKKMKFVSKFGNKSEYNLYKAIDKNYIKEIYDKF